MIKYLQTHDIKDLKKHIKEKQYNSNGLAHIDIPIVFHCNLNCASCDHFAPLSEENYVNVDELIKCMQRLQVILHGKPLMNINLMGGEPLLHPQLRQITLAIQKIFPNTSITIVTNGILLNDDLINFCKVNNIKIDKTDYFKNKYFYKPNLQEYKSNNTFICNNKTIDIDSIKNESKEMLEFYNSSPCTQLNPNGDFFGCIIPANIHIFNKYFNTNLQPIKNKDYFNIFEIDNINDIIHMNNCSQIPFCQYCQKKELIQWTISKKDKYEWLQ